MFYLRTKVIQKARLVGRAFCVVIFTPGFRASSISVSELPRKPRPKSLTNVVLV
jgi:hypothetical protein